MKKRVTAALLFAALSARTPALAASSASGTIWITIDVAPACVNQQDLLRAVGTESGARPLLVTGAVAPTMGNGDVHVTVRGGPTKFQVQIAGTQQANETLAPGSCASAAPVLAAFVTSVLAPPPPLPALAAVEATPPTTSAVVPADIAIGEVGRDPKLSENVALLAAAFAPGQGSPSQDSQALAFKITPGLIALNGGLWTAIAATQSTDAPTRPLSRLFVLGGLGSATVGALASYLVPDDYRLTVLYDAFTLGVATAALGGAVAPPSTFNNATLALVAATGYTLVGFDLIETLLQRPISPVQVRADYESIRTPEQRSRLSRQDLAALDARFRRSAGVIPPLVKTLIFEGLAIGMLVGGAGDKNPEHRATAYLAGGMTMTFTALFGGLAELYGYRRYNATVSAAGLSPVLIAGGAGLQIVGAF
jgi:hypothetical protein